MKKLNKIVYIEKDNILQGETLMTREYNNL